MRFVLLLSLTLTACGSHSSDNSSSTQSTAEVTGEFLKGNYLVLAKQGFDLSNCAQSIGHIPGFMILGTANKETRIIKINAYGSGAYDQSILKLSCVEKIIGRVVD